LETVLPMPKILVKLISTRSFFGKSMPAILTLCFLSYPCLCLCLGLLHMTLTTPSLLITLHFAQIGFTDERTFIYISVFLNKANEPDLSLRLYPLI